ncbi:MAG: GNAT family N-acetyltransferase [Oscillospiraceae bacterium]|nr:GNAT family N-acetyltransferase [Oscillospiraceae bacterium]
MIRQLVTDSELNTALLRQSWRGRKMYSYYKAYGLDYSFCQFYAVGEGGILLRLNDTVLICDAQEEDAEELAVFLRMHRPFRVECNEPVRTQLAALLPEYRSLHRTMFQLVPDAVADDVEDAVEFNPPLADVYEILKAGFPNLQDYAMWLTDTSHRCRHGVSRVFTYKGSTTASIMFDIDDSVLVGQVATRPEARGLGHARIFLRWLAGFLAQFGKTAVLYALDVRESFYREIGFTALETEYVLELMEQEQDNLQKGRLDNGNS